MEKDTIELLFALIKSTICGTRPDEKQISLYSMEKFQELLDLAKKHDVEHLLVLGLKNNSLIENSDLKTIKIMHKAFFRYEKLMPDYESLCGALEDAEIPYVPLKGSVIRKYYPEEWMRTSCDVDILVHGKDIDRAVAYLVNTLGYEEKERATHDISLYTKRGNHIELHFDLLEEERANNAIDILEKVWENVTLCNGSNFRYEMSDEFFYFYHIAHMAKHFESGGCGISPFIDLFILDNVCAENIEKRNELLKRGGLLQFADNVRKLAEVWFGNREHDSVTLAIQSFILDGGVYGTYDNKIALKQSKDGGKGGYVLSRVFVSYDTLKRYYPVLEKHGWLAPVMQVRRWFRLLNPEVAKRARKEVKVNNRVADSKVDTLRSFFNNIGL